MTDLIQINNQFILTDEAIKALNNFKGAINAAPSTIIFPQVGDKLRFAELPSTTFVVLERGINYAATDRINIEYLVDIIEQDQRQKSGLKVI